MDYIVPEQMQLTFYPGDFEKTINISIVNDDVVEGQAPEFFSLSLHTPMSDLMVELPNPTTNIFITDNDRGEL